MGYAVAHSTRTMLRNLQNDKEYRLTEIAHKMQQLVRKSSEISQKYAQHLTQYLNDSDDDLIYVGELEEVFLDYQPEMERINSVEKELEAQKIQIQTELTAIKASLESFDKLEQDGIKDTKIAGSSSSTT